LCNRAQRYALLERFSQVGFVHVLAIADITLADLIVTAHLGGRNRAEILMTTKLATRNRFPESMT
jgi:hypothetical protein